MCAATPTGQVGTAQPLSDTLGPGRNRFSRLREYSITARGPQCISNLQKAAQAADEAWQHMVHGHTGPKNRCSARLQKWNKLTPLHKHTNTQKKSRVPARRGRLNTPQLQAQLSRLSDRTRLRRQKKKRPNKDTLSQEAHTPEGLCGERPLAARLLWPTCKKRLGNRRPRRRRRMSSVCGIVLDSHPEHCEMCSTAEATRGHHARVHAVLGGLKLADPGVTTAPRGLTGSNIQTG